MEKTATKKLLTVNLADWKRKELTGPHYNAPKSRCHKILIDVKTPDRAMRTWPHKLEIQKFEKALSNTELNQESASRDQRTSIHPLPNAEQQNWTDLLCIYHQKGWLTATPPIPSPISSTFRLPRLDRCTIHDPNGRETGRLETSPKSWTTQIWLGQTCNQPL